MDVLNPTAAAEIKPSALMPRTALASDLSTVHPDLPLALIAGLFTPATFSTLAEELDALLHGCGIYDLGWKALISIKGEDRLRWLSGMVTNAVQQLADGQGNYSFLLNAQGRIQGDGYVFREAGQLLLETEADQVEKLMAHLEQFIIMDDVSLAPLSEHIGAIGLSGPQTTALLAMFGVTMPEVPSTASAAFLTANLCGNPVYAVSIVAAQPGSYRYELWGSHASLRTVWNHLLSVQARPCGLHAVQALRILEGIPLYGVDLVDRDLPQETSQDRALNFNKGCYLGQEIVERIRSRGAVHRGLRRFKLTTLPSSLPVELKAGEGAVGRLTSAAAFPDGSVYALGIVRTEAVIRDGSLTYNEGTAVALDQTPVLLST